jgi:hypothetical protein
MPPDKRKRILKRCVLKSTAWTQHRPQRAVLTNPKLLLLLVSSHVSIGNSWMILVIYCYLPPASTTSSSSSSDN